jgi:hypothetical protein
LERERNSQEGTIAKRASQIEVFKNATKKCKDELKRSTEANEAQKEELGRLTDEIKAMKAKKGRLGDEVAELTNLLKHTVLHPDRANAGEIIKRIFPESKQFPPSVKKGQKFDVPQGLIAHLTRECGGNVHDRGVVDVTCGSFEKETGGANPHSGAYDNQPKFAAKNAADLETDSVLLSACRDLNEEIPHTRNNWLRRATCLTIVAHPSPAIITSFHHQEHQNIVRNSQSALLISLLKPSVDVLRQYSLPFWACAQPHT